MGVHLIETKISGLLLIKPFFFEDNRGQFKKYVSACSFREKGIECAFQESFLSVSKQDVIRGMHFQVPPFDCEKVVYVNSGAILDIVVDLRKASSTFGKFYFKQLDTYRREGLYIPKGCAHGFLSLIKNTEVAYHQTKVHSPEHDQGILWSSFGADWGISHPILSERDATWPPFKEFKTPF